MCVIIRLKPKQMIPGEMLRNAVYNNWHSYGLVTKIDGRLDIKRKVPESGEVDPDEVYALLQDDFEFERWLHLRHNTAGATTLENTHPFEVFFKQGKNPRHVVWMHNGTLYPYVSKKTTPYGSTVDDPDGPSDSKNFVEQVIIPYISSMDFGNGKGDIENFHFQNLIKKFWTPVHSNRSVFISSDQRPFCIGEWKEIGEEGNKILVSNDDYFSEVKRGPEKARREEEEKKRKALAVKNFTTSSRETPGVVEVAKLSDYPEKQHGFYGLKHSLANILQDWDVYDREGAVALGWATREELEDIYKHKSDCLYLMDWIFTDYAKLYEEHIQEQKKHDSATKIIASLKNEIEELKQKLSKLESKPKKKEKAA